MQPTGDFLINLDYCRAYNNLDCFCCTHKKFCCYDGRRLEIEKEIAINSSKYEIAKLEKQIGYGISEDYNKKLLLKEMETKEELIHSLIKKHEMYIASEKGA